MTPPDISSRDTFQRLPFPPERSLVLDTLALGRRKPMMHGFLELDVSRARRLLREQRAQDGEALSFTAFLLACVGRAVAAHPEVHALRDWYGRLVSFEDVDATLIVEVKVEGRAFALAHVLRAINRRSVQDIHAEIRAVQAAGVGSVPAGLRLSARALARVPAFLRRLVYRALLASPHFAKRHTGTLLVSALGMFARGTTGWGVSAPGIHNFSILIGGLATRADAREILCLTVSANHEVVDGALLARFVADLARAVDEATLLTEA